jgi:hypothetical protein
MHSQSFLLLTSLSVGGHLPSADFLFPFLLACFEIRNLRGKKNKHNFISGQFVSVDEKLNVSL